MCVCVFQLLATEQTIDEGDEEEAEDEREEKEREEEKRESFLGYGFGLGFSTRLIVDDGSFSFGFFSSQQQQNKKKNLLLLLRLLHLLH